MAAPTPVLEGRKKGDGELDLCRDQSWVSSLVSMLDSRLSFRLLL